MLKMTGKPYFFTGGMFDGEKLIALSLAEKCGDTLIIHIEKALYSYTGVYPALVRHSPTPLAMAASGSTGRMTRRTRASGLPSSSTARPGWRPSTGSIPRMSC